MLQLIAPPVGPDSDPREVSRWIATLQRLGGEYQEFPQVVAAVEWRLGEAREWLSRRREAA